MYPYKPTVAIEIAKQRLVQCEDLHHHTNWTIIGICDVLDICNAWKQRISRYFLSRCLSGCQSFSEMHR